MSIRKTLPIFLSLFTFVVASLPEAQAGGVAGLARKSMGSFKTMREGSKTLAPFPFIRYCVSNPPACEAGGNPAIDWSPDTKSLVVSVNRQVNGSIRPVRDRQEEWNANVRAGDCEDFALTKRIALMKAGLPASALRMAVAVTASGEGHAVLVVKTNSGDFVLDNRTNRMLIWNETDLTFLKIASAENPRLWRRLL